MVAKKEQFRNKPKETVIRARVDNEIVEKLDFCADQKNTTRSGIIRLGIEKVYDELQNKKQS